MSKLLELLSKGRDEGGNRPSGDNNAIESNLDDDSESVGFADAAGDAFHSLKSGDVDGFREALQAAIEMVR